MNPATLLKACDRSWLAMLTLFLSCLCSSSGVAAEQLVLSYVVFDGAQRTAWARIIGEFNSQNPDVQVTLNGYAPESYRQNFLTPLQAGKVDLAFWPAGERLRDAAANHALVPLDADIVALLKKEKFSLATIESTRINGKVYGFPMYYYPWGFIYRKSLFTRLNISLPTDWNEFLLVCEHLSASGVTPIGLGAANNWPAAGWIDYFNLRLNGLEFHRKFLRGDVPFTDARVRRVFDIWGDLLRKGYFLQSTMELDQERILPYIYRNQVGMMLMGTFIASKFPKEVEDDIGFFAFPRISPDIPMYEDAPLDVLVLPANAPNPQSRKRFLTFLATSGAISHIAEVAQTLPAKTNSPMQPILLGDEARAVLSGAAGLSSFFDREARADLIGPTYEAMRQFLKPPHDTDQAVTTVEKLRKK